jgi:hypothetical protein
MLTLKPPPLPSPANENSLSVPEARKIVRTFSAYGPCLTEGELVKTTDKFYVFLKWHGGDRFEGERRISCAKAHIEPCSSCRDHVRTQYPHGYMD